MNRIDDWSERISALADGELGDDALAHLLEQAHGAHESRSLQAAWSTYHLAGEILRTGRHAPGTAPGVFLGRLREQLAREQPPSWQTSPPPAVEHHRVEHSALKAQDAANEPAFRWKMAASVATLVAVAAISWNWIGNGGALEHARLAQRQSMEPMAVSTASGASEDTPEVASAMLRDPRLDALLEAHEEIAGVSRIPSGFLRDATFEVHVAR
ncbi:MAG: sigma-E factor negative regulatory protein [Burkholderiaceae bacterium]|jgi:sigma-E factor negative regulatory protein RseA|nr:sigma-E factor negative regulatory protein [Burkholderiaceae bacterium]